MLAGRCQAHSEIFECSALAQEFRTLVEFDLHFISKADDDAKLLQRVDAVLPPTSVV